MLLSGFQNAHSIHAAQQAVDAIAAAPNTASALRALLGLQHEIARYAPDRDHLARSLPASVSIATPPSLPRCGTDTANTAGS